jgi:hypothetical protein
MAAATARGTSDACIVAWPSPVRAAVRSKRCDLGHRTKLSRESRGGATGGARLNRRSAPFGCSADNRQTTQTIPVAALASWTGEATGGTRAEHARVPLRRDHAVEVRVRSFSTNSRPALRAAACGGRPRAGSDTTATEEPASPAVTVKDRSRPNPLPQAAVCEAAAPAKQTKAGAQPWRRRWRFELGSGLGAEPRARAGLASSRPPRALVTRSASRRSRLRRPRDSRNCRA